MSGFPFESKVQAPILVRNLIGDEKPEIVTKSKDSTLIYIISSKGEILYKINSLKNEKLVCLDSFNNQSSMVTNKRLNWISERNQITVDVEISIMRSRTSP